MTPRIAPLVTGLVLVFALQACSTSTPVEDAPLEPDQQSELECFVVGSWYHQSSDGSPIIEAAQNIYHLEADGTGHIEPNEGSQQMGMMGSKLTDFEWWLEGRNLFLERDDGQTDVFRVDAWSGHEMDWFYYANSMHYGVGRDAGEDVPDC